MGTANLQLAVVKEKTARSVIRGEIVILG